MNPLSRSVLHAHATWPSIQAGFMSYHACMQACVDLYHDGTILEIYQKARRDIGQRPWRVDDFDALEAAFFPPSSKPLNARGAPLRRCIFPQR